MTLNDLLALREGMTPGRWHIVPYDAGDMPYRSGVPSIVAPDEIDCAIVHWDGFKQEYWQSARGEKEMQANARAIASLPLLFDKLAEMKAAGDALLAVVNAVREYLPPDGISADEFINLVIGATDNDEINPIIRELENGRD